jgi:hypothetical protein
LQGRKLKGELLASFFKMSDIKSLKELLQFSKCQLKTMRSISGMITFFTSETMMIEGRALKERRWC